MIFGSTPESHGQDRSVTWSTSSTRPLAGATSQLSTDTELVREVIAFDRFKPRVSMETIEPLRAEEVANVWRLRKAGVVRENYARADEPGVVIVFEVASLDEARAYVADCSMTKAGTCSGPTGP
jgi:hypothetical protein